MNLKTLNHFWRKPSAQPAHTSSVGGDNIAVHSLYVLRPYSYPCDICRLESPDCFKLHFANTTVCVAPKDCVNDFSSKHRTTPKDHQK